MAAWVLCQAMVVRRPLAITQRMSRWSSGWAARVVTMVLGDIGGSGLLTGLTRRGTEFLVGKVFDMLIEVLKDIWAGWQDQLDVCKLK
jgi:hypothetical protein